MISMAKLRHASERDVSLAEKYVSNLGFLLFTLFLLRYLAIFSARHSVCIAEKTGESYTTGNARQLADETYCIVGGLK